jgi:hypothetical protein
MSAKKQIIVVQPAGSKPHRQFKLRLAMLAQQGDQDIGQGDVSPRPALDFGVLNRDPDAPGNSGHFAPHRSFML